VALSPSSTYGGTYSANVQFTLPDFNYKDTYTFQIKANDKLIDLAEKEYVITALPVFDWSKDDVKFNVPIKLGNTQLTEEQLIRLLALI